jgi:Protein of unknown function (DUF3175)
MCPAYRATGDSGSPYNPTFDLVSHRTIQAGREAMAKKKKWVRNVKTISTAPPKDLFTKDARTIANTMAKKSVSSKGIGSGIRMIQFFINRGGKNLSVTRRRELEKAKAILQRRMKAKNE